MDFLDRKDEISELSRVLEKGSKSRFIVVYGRRRLGKSTLIKRVLRKEDLYYMAGDFIESVQREMMVTQLSEKFPEFALAEFSDWESIFRMLNSLTKEKFTLTIDEFPYIVKHSPELPSILQRLIDSKSLKYNLVICGSSQRMMQNMILSPVAPLYGRADVLIDVRPIPISFLQEGLNLNPIETVEEYSVWGGVPRYWELREDYPNLKEAIKGTLLSPTAVLYDEPKRLFLDEMNATVQSESLMSVIAAGANRLSEIASRMRRDATSLSAPLDKLIQMSYLRRETPFGESVKKSKRGIYRINDPMMNFYYSFIIPNLSSIGRGRKSFVLQNIETHFNEYVAHHWEHLCKEAVSGNQLFGHYWGEASRWWGSVREGSEITSMEFDVIAESSDRKALLVGECKWTNPEISSEISEKLIKKAAKLPFAKDKEIVPALFFKSIPKDTPPSHCHILYPKDVIKLSYGE